jgi:L-alanine-DL-glutamate epimerase-like enolase superfamily enzyme
MANVHLGAAVASLTAVEHHALDIPWWTDLVTGLPPDYLDEGYVAVPDAPGLGIDLNEEVVRAHLEPGKDFFGDTAEWNRERVGFLGHHVR